MHSQSYLVSLFCCSESRVRICLIFLLPPAFSLSLSRQQHDNVFNTCGRRSEGERARARRVGVRAKESEEQELRPADRLVPCSSRFILLAFFFFVFLSSASTATAIARFPVLSAPAALPPIQFLCCQVKIPRLCTRDTGSREFACCPDAAATPAAAALTLLLLLLLYQCCTNSQDVQ